MPIGIGYTTPLDWLEIVGGYEWTKIEVDDISPPDHEKAQVDAMAILGYVRRFQ
ncbi:MAG: hypothetical protein KZQ76_08410 [Candidatus Thiodiazotropha sp. (ex Epidulcina cf. delphinae)]|nr:hypothetical protein [Candidatus Thiodiazotropha sp. (ex Epidulcina cf. delphinae)]